MSWVSPAVVIKSYCRAEIVPKTSPAIRVENLKVVTWPITLKPSDGYRSRFPQRGHGRGIEDVAGVDKRSYHGGGEGSEGEGGLLGGGEGAGGVLKSLMKPFSRLDLSRSQVLILL